MTEDQASDRSGDGPAGKAGFLGGLLAVGALIALSVVGLGHARTIAGAANAQYWIVVALVAGAFGFVLQALARTSAASPGGEAARKIAVGLGALWLVAFVWETAAIGSGAFAGPFELAWAAYKG